jgi:hypothetical protein
MVYNSANFSIMVICLIDDSIQKCKKYFSLLVEPVLSFIINRDLILFLG